MFMFPQFEFPRFKPAFFSSCFSSVLKPKVDLKTFIKTNQLAGGGGGGGGGGEVCAVKCLPLKIGA